MSNITITWYGHSCFSVSSGNYSIVLDPYAPDSVPGLAPLTLSANQVLCSHHHGDHGYSDAVTVTDGSNSPFSVLCLPSWHDDSQGSLRGENMIHILETDGLRIAHLGDLGCEPMPEQMEQLCNLDALLIPIGGHYTIDAAQAKNLVEKLAPRVVIPMHYRSDSFGYAVIGCLEDYTAKCSDVITYKTNSIVIDKDTSKHTAVLTLA